MTSILAGAMTYWVKDYAHDRWVKSLNDQAAVISHRHPEVHVTTIAFDNSPWEEGREYTYKLQRDLDRVLAVGRQPEETWQQMHKLAWQFFAHESKFYDYVYIEESDQIAPANMLADLYGELLSCDMMDLVIQACQPRGGGPLRGHWHHACVLFRPEGLQDAVRRMSETQWEEGAFESLLLTVPRKEVDFGWVEHLQGPHHYTGWAVKEL